MNKDAETKGEKIAAIVRVIKTGFAPSGPMNIDTSFVLFILPDKRDVIWHSENAARAAAVLKPGTSVGLRAFLYGKKLRRVQVFKDDRILGMNESYHRMA